MEMTSTSLINPWLIRDVYFITSTYHIGLENRPSLRLHVAVVCNIVYYKGLFVQEWDLFD